MHTASLGLVVGFVLRVFYLDTLFSVLFVDFSQTLGLCLRSLALNFVPSGGQLRFALSSQVLLGII